jgi:hypothetical protein
MPKFFSPYLLVRSLGSRSHCMSCARAAQVTSESCGVPLQALPMAVGTLLPSAVIALSLLLGDQGLLAATCLAPYMLTLLCQIWMEGVFIQRSAHLAAFDAQLPALD